MIFYFSATGNSKYAAERIAAATGERLVSLSDAVRERRYRYDASGESRIGFVFPVYFQGMPSILRFFLDKLELTNCREPYIYAVLTCGSMTGDTSGQLAKILKKKGLTLSARFGIQMPENYAPMFAVPDAEEARRVLEAAEPVIDEAIRAIQAKGIGDYDRRRGPAPAAQTAMLYPVYWRGRSTKPFVVTEHCIGCGLCRDVCPCGAIVLAGGQPAWVKPKCVRCLTCLHRCPAQAIHWGKPDENNGRYYNPLTTP